MGLFAHRPEEPTEWAGLPSEPARHETAAERLPEPSSALDALGLGGGAVESIVIPVAPVVEIAEDGAGSGQGDGRGDGDDAEGD